LHNLISVIHSEHHRMTTIIFKIMFYNLM